MTPGTRVRIDYPGDCKHGAIGRVAAVRKVGSMKEHTVQLERPIRISGCKPIWRVYVTASRLRPIAEDPNREPQAMRTAAPPAPQRARVSAKKASPAPVKVVKPIATITRFDDAITMAEAARILSVNRQTVKNMIVRGDLEGYQQGKLKTWHLSRAAIEKLAETYQDGRRLSKPRHSRGVK